MPFAVIFGLSGSVRFSAATRGKSFCWTPYLCPSKPCSKSQKEKGWKSSIRWYDNLDMGVQLLGIDEDFDKREDNPLQAVHKSLYDPGGLNHQDGPDVVGHTCPTPLGVRE